MKRYVYYQPNKLDVKDKYGDCTIRALSKVLGLNWIDTYLKTVPYCIKYQTPNIFNLPQKLEAEVMEDMGFTYHGVSNKKGTKRPTVYSFAKEHGNGKYILNVANHEVAVVDGQYFDTWDCGQCSLYGWYEKI